MFERFPARVQHLAGDTVILEGGLVLELRLRRARTTKDVDLRMMGTPAELLDRLQAAGRLDLGNFMRFEIQRDRLHPEIRGEGMKYAGHRFAAECRLAGKIYGRRFGVDVGFGDPLVGEPDEIIGDRLLDFAGIGPARLHLYPVVSHIASHIVSHIVSHIDEKLHAYTMPRERPNSRIKDLPDLALLASTGEIDAVQLRTALETAFEFQRTHALPDELAFPPTEWVEAYRAMASADELAWPTLADANRAARDFLEPVLSKRPSAGRWAPSPDYS
ncbi:MAG: nucleotidyl transferase AbiEii/AbiGii toxin family protein [Planctomycetota bacterium]